ncbi:VOC family protein [Taibaiella chishuiensis]|uniref:Lactoylglutathione lyase n=1 Tax=Taibaiella chishuiensis TaxID=1434707 RepID=A0A2P8CVX7_9BACT|nr:VOC family protein [Taibaiella chishuiensis]PSK89100.1 lactoylglutathione lyase [Taibaiella chishuiensis]
MTTQNKHGITGIHHIAIRATDFEATLAFYTQALGFSLSHSWSLPAFNLKQAAMLRAADGLSYIELYDEAADIATQGRKRLPGEPLTQTALLHICLGTGDAAAAFHRAIAYGATPCIEPMALELGEPAIKVRNALVYSPNGEVIEFLEPVAF